LGNLRGIKASRRQKSRVSFAYGRICNAARWRHARLEKLVMPGAERILAYLNFIAELVLLWRLVQCQFYRTYRSLFWYWLVQAFTTLTLLSIPPRTFRYLYIYWGTETITVVMAVFVVQDLYRIALLEHPAVASFGRRSVMIILAIAGVIALSGIAMDATILPAGHYPAIHHFATFERSMNFVILLFLLLISGLLLWFPIRVRRNIAVYISGFVLFSAARSGGLLVSNLLPQAATLTVSTILLGLTLLCLLIWIVGIRPEGERATATPGYRRDPEAMQRLSRQLDTINATLARFGRG